MARFLGKAKMAEIGGRLVGIKHTCVCVDYVHGVEIVQFTI